jgi:hypothetical protein
MEAECLRPTLRGRFQKGGLSVLWIETALRLFQNLIARLVSSISFLA